MNQSVKSQQCIQPSVREAPSTSIPRSSQQLNISETSLRLILHKDLGYRHTKSNWFKSWSQLTIQCVFVSLSRLAVDLKKTPILAKKKISFSDEAHYDLGWHVNKQNCCIWGPENPHAYIEKPMHPKRVTVWCEFWPRGIIGPLFWKWARSGRYCQWWSFSGHFERIFVHKNWSGAYWQHLVSTGWGYQPHSRSYTRCFTPGFLKIALSAAPPRSCDLTPLNYYLRGAIKDKSYADKRETIDG